MPNKILICVSKTGGGHQSAACAIRSAIEELAQTPEYKGRQFEVKVADAVEESNLVHRFYVGLYNLLLRHRQSWMKYYYALIEWMKPNNCELGYRLARKYAKTLISSNQPAIVVSAHPMANHYLARALQELNLPQKPKLIVVMTDPNGHFWSGWACADADLTIAPNQLARDRLIEFGIKPEKIRTIGMPIHPTYLKPPQESRELLLSRLSLDPDRELLTICLNAGWAGGGNVEPIFEALARVHRKIQVIAICGGNTDLRAHIRKLSERCQIPTAALTHEPTLADIMSASDLLITKAGGLTTFEAIARHLPMALDMLTEPMPQEIGTAKLLIDSGLARPIRHAGDIVAIVDQLDVIDRNDREKRPLPAAFNLNRTDSVYEIARTVMSGCSISLEESPARAPIHPPPSFIPMVEANQPKAR